MAGPTNIPGLEERPIDRLLSPIQSFLRIEASGGILLLACAVVAMVWANSAWAESYDHFWHTYVTVGFGEYTLSLSLAHFVNDGLMAIFFFVVGLEIKREVLIGELASMRKAAVPIMAALGGMVVPAVVYTVLDGGGEAARGWGIPMATDIAFALGVLALLGKRVPLSLKVFLTALAIVDDLGAIVVIAVFYTEEFFLEALIFAGVALIVSAVVNRLGVRTPIVYGLIGLAMWLMLLKSGVHATIGGVLLAFTIPASVRVDGPRLMGFAKGVLESIERDGGGVADIRSSPKRQQLVYALERACERSQTPLNRLEHNLHVWVAVLIMPIFALANAGIPLGKGFGDAIGSGVGIGVALGLLLGKPVGVVGATWLAVKLGFGDLPEGSNWKQIVAVGFLSGIGFTMSLFIANLAFRDMGMLQLAKVGILSGSLIAGIVGLILMHFASPARPADAPP